MNQNITAHDILADLHGKLEKSKRTGDKLMARCPAHDDKTASLSVTIGDNDCVVAHCFAGCPAEDVVAALGWEMRDLFTTGDAWRSHEARTSATKRTRRHGRRRPSLRTRLAACGSGLTR